MPKQVRHDKGVILNSFQNPILEFRIHLTFACLPRTSTVRGLPVGRVAATVHMFSRIISLNSFLSVSLDREESIDRYSSTVSK